MTLFEIMYAIFEIMYVIFLHWKIHNLLFKGHRKYINVEFLFCNRWLIKVLSSTLAWKIPWTEEPGGLQSMGSLKVGHDWATSLSLFTFMHWRRKWRPTPVFLPGESQGWGSLLGCRLWGRTVGHNWSDLAAAAAAAGPNNFLVDFSWIF